MVAAGINHRVIVDKLAAVEPERILFLLRAGTFHHVAAMDDKGRVIRRDGCVKGALGVKLMGVGNRNIADLGRVLLQCTESTPADFAIRQRHFIIIAGARRQVRKFVAENVGLRPAIVGRFRVTFDRNSLPQCVGICAEPYGRRFAARCLPYGDHAGRLGGKQIWPYDKAGARRRVCCKSCRNHGQNHGNGQQ